MASSSHGFGLFFGLVLFFFSSTPSLQQALEFVDTASAPNQWNNTNNPNTAIFQDAVTSFILLSAQVACGFICHVPNCNDNYFFAIFSLQLASPKANASIIWMANRDKPVGRNATVQFTNDGNLSLYDDNGTSIWSTGTSGSSAVSISITEAGNLVLLDQQNIAVWQSSDHLGDAWFLSQALREGQKLTRERYYATVLDDGLYAFLDSQPPQVTCFLRSNNVTLGNVNSYVQYDDSELVLYASNQRTDVLERVTGEPTFGCLTVEEGHLKILDWSSGAWKATDDLCSNNFNPLVCGEYGVYSDGKCTCPGGTDSGNGSYFKLNDPGREELGCSPVTVLDCRARQDHQFLNLTEVAYFSYIDVRAAAFNGTDEQSCVQACLGNCSCKAALFMYHQNVTDGSCFLPSQLFSLQTNIPGVSGYHSNAHIKVQRPALDALMAEPVKKSSNVGVVLGSVLGALSFLLFVGIVIIVLVIRRRKQDPGKSFGNEEPLEEQFEEISGMPTRFSFEQLALATDNFGKKLGEGGFGSVFMGALGKDNIAVKLLSGINQGRKEFLAEVQTIGKTHHFNLVRLIGFCAEKSHRMLVYEYMPNGSLDKWIFNRDQRTTLSWQMRCKIIADIARGLSYLHEECPQRIVHLDIKPQNILLDDKFNAKVSDFGLAKLIERDQTHVMTMMRGTPGYLAPEWLTSFITEKVDVYSFGVMVLEIVCVRKNLDPSQPPERAHLVRLLQDKIKMDRLLDLVSDNEIDIAVDQDEVINMIKLGTWCLNHDPCRRPSMSTVVKVLEGVVNVETGVESNFIASIPAMQNQSYDLSTSLSDYASSASPPPSASLLPGAR